MTDPTTQQEADQAAETLKTQQAETEAKQAEAAQAQADAEKAANDQAEAETKQAEAEQAEAEAEQATDALKIEQKEAEDKAAAAENDTLNIGQNGNDDTLNISQNGNDTLTIQQPAIENAAPANEYTGGQTITPVGQGEKSGFDYPWYTSFNKPNKDLVGAIDGAIKKVTGAGEPAAAMAEMVFMPAEFAMDFIEGWFKHHGAKRDAKKEYIAKEYEKVLKANPSTPLTSVTSKDYAIVMMDSAISARQQTLGEMKEKEPEFYNKLPKNEKGELDLMAFSDEQRKHIADKAVPLAQQNLTTKLTNVLGRRISEAENQQFFNKMTTELAGKDGKGGALSMTEMKNAEKPAAKMSLKELAGKSRIYKASTAAIKEGLGIFNRKKSAHDTRAQSNQSTQAQILGANTPQKPAQTPNIGLGKDNSNG